MHSLKTIRDLDVSGKRVLARVDFNVPQENGQIIDDTRIRGALPTIRYLVEGGAKLVLASHLGRPQGKPVESLRMDPIAERLSELLVRPVLKLDDCVGEMVEWAVSGMKPGEVVLLENTRFHEGETKNDPVFAEALARVGELFVNDAFGTAHRAHASNYGVAKHLPAVAGLLMAKEVEQLSRAVEDPEMPFVTIIGGKKAGSKIGVLHDLMDRVETFLIGGGVAFTFLAAQGYGIGDSVVDEQMLDEAARLIETADHHGVSLLLPVDLRIAERFDAGAVTRIVPVDGIPQGWIGLDIGPETVAAFNAQVARARTIVWAGPLGAFELEPFIEGTQQVAEAVATSAAFSIIGGGETAAAIVKLGLADRMDHVSTGGGASLAFLQGKTLPAIELLQADR